MSDQARTPSLVPKAFRFADVDHFRSSVRHINVDFTPLARTISAEQIILNLAGCDVNFTKSFPRIIDAQLEPDCTAIGFSMDDGVPIRFNGVERDHSIFVIGSNGAVYNAVERVERRYASIVFKPAIEDRGWPDTDASFKMFEIGQAQQHRLRRLVTQVLKVSPEFAEPIDAGEAASAIRESLLAAIDAAFADVVPMRWASRANTSRQFKIFQDLRAILAANIASPLYSADIAKALGVSVRTIHDTVLRYRGMSLHRYLRLRRLWLVRKQLLSGSSSVKASALAFGFWHMGDFSHSYRLQFGESASETLERASRS
jgi:AraC family ethanolamine operon transcriptional activator